MTKDRIALFALFLIFIALSASLFVTTGSLNRTIQDQKTEINGLTSEVNALNSTIIELEKNLTIAHSEIANLTSLLDSEKERADDLENQNKLLNSTIAELQGQIDGLNNQNSALQSEIAELQTQVAQLNNTITMLESDKTNLQSRIDYLTGIINMSRSLKLKTLIFHVCEKRDGYSWGHLRSAISTYNEVLALNNGVYEILFLPEYQGNENWTEAYDWIKTNFKGIPLMLSVFEGICLMKLQPISLLLIPFQIALAVFSYFFSHALTRA